MAVPEVAEAIMELAAAVDRQTMYLERRDNVAREDWLKARVEDIEIAEERRDQDAARRSMERENDWERALVLRGVDGTLASTLSQAMTRVPGSTRRPEKD